MITQAERIAELEALVQHYEEELGIRRDEELEYEIAHRFRLAPLLAQTLVVFYKARGRTLSKYHVNSVLASRDKDREDLQIKVVDVYVGRLRKAFGFDSIETVWAIGHRMSKPMIALLDELAEEIKA